MQARWYLVFFGVFFFMGLSFLDMVRVSPIHREAQPPRSATPPRIPHRACKNCQAVQPLHTARTAAPAGILSPAPRGRYALPDGHRRTRGAARGTRAAAPALRQPPARRAPRLERDGPRLR